MAIELNEEQKTIVEYDGDKFLSVQAGPGSGKTRVIVEKVKYMVKELGINPESFLIITFSIKAADELKDRLIEGEIPASDVQKMQISTIHSFCLKILEETGTVGLDIIAEGDKQNLFIKKHSGNGSAFENKLAVFINFNSRIMVFGIIGNDFVSPFGFVNREGNISFHSVFHHCHFITVS